MPPQPGSSAQLNVSDGLTEPDGRMASASVTGARLARRLFGNYLFQMVNLGIRMFDQLLLIPLYLLAWGTELYKDWLVLMAVVLFLYTCSFGIEDYFSNRFLRAVSTGDTAALRRQVRVGMLIASAISAAILLLAYVAIVTLDLKRLLGLSAMSEHTAIIVVLVTTLPLSGWFAVMILHALYRAYGDFTRGECIFAIYAAVQLFSVMICLVLHQPPSVVAFCHGFAPLLCAVITVIDVRRRYPAIRLGLALPTRAEWREIVPQSLLYFTNTLSWPLTQSATLIVFALYDFSATTIVTFNVCRVFAGLTRMIGAQSFSVGSGIEMARQYTQADHEACRRLYTNTGRVVACIAGVLSGVSIPLSTPFIHLWTHGTIAAEPALILIFLAGIYFSSPGRASLMLLRYTNHARSIAWANGVYSVGGLMLAVLLARPLGGVGVAAAYAFTEVVGIGLYPPLMVKRRFGFSAFRHMLQSFLMGACGFAVSYAVAVPAFMDVRGGGILALAPRAVLWAAVVLPVGVLLIVPRAQRDRLFGWFVGRMPRQWLRVRS
jgi:O-antigen/teichoic acid export membrane protein